MIPPGGGVRNGERRLSAAAAERDQHRKHIKDKETEQHALFRYTVFPHQFTKKPPFGNCSVKKINSTEIGRAHV